MTCDDAAGSGVATGYVEPLLRGPISAIVLGTTLLRGSMAAEIKEGGRGMGSIPVAGFVHLRPVSGTSRDTRAAALRLLHHMPAGWCGQLFSGDATASVLMAGSFGDDGDALAQWRGNALRAAADAGLNSPPAFRAPDSVRVSFDVDVPAAGEPGTEPHDALEVHCPPGPSAYFTTVTVGLHVAPRTFDLAAAGTFCRGAYPNDEMTVQFTERAGWYTCDHADDRMLVQHQASTQTLAVSAVLAGAQDLWRAVADGAANLGLVQHSGSLRTFSRSVVSAPVRPAVAVWSEESAPTALSPAMRREGAATAIPVAGDRDRSRLN